MRNPIAVRNCHPRYWRICVKTVSTSHWILNLTIWYQPMTLFSLVLMWSLTYVCVCWATNSNLSMFSSPLCEKYEYFLLTPNAAYELW